MAIGKEVNLEDKYVRWFSDLGKNSTKEVGGKAANLGEMIKIGMPVPQGFAITAKGYEYFLESTGLKEKIYELLKKIDIEDTKELDITAKKIREMIEQAEMPKDLKEEIVDAYEVLSFPVLEHATSDVLSILKKGNEPVFVAVRSSATAEDTSAASFAGQNETFLNIKGNVALIEAVKSCFASLFTARSVYYRIKKGFKHEDVLIAVAVQLMINSDKSGVMFSRDPVAHTENIVVEAVFGLGEGIVSGRIEPDNYIVSRDLKILNIRVADKKTAIARDSSGKNQIIKLTEDKSKQQVLREQEVKKLASYALKLEEHYKIPQDIEFAIDSGNISIVQTRPITTLGKEKLKESEIKGEIKGKLLLEGLAASPGTGFGIVKIVRNLQDLEKIKSGDILVTEMTNPDMVVSMQKASGIVTNEGGQTCHAAIISREMGIPAVVGTKKATEILKDGMMVTVDGFKGKVYEGKSEGKIEKIEIKPIVSTQTKIKAIVDLPDFAERAALTECKDVGLVRLEGIIAESGKHPFYFLQNGNIKEYEEIIFLGLKEIAKYFNELWVRTSDIRSDEYRNLQGASKQVELNPMLGMHGIRAGLKFPDILKSEIKAMMRLAEDKKIGIMMPQVISVDEVVQVKNILNELNAENLKLGVMIETPAAVQIIDELCKQGISFISFGTNDLTQYTLAIDRGNEEVQYLYNEMHPSVLKQLAYVISVCKKYNVETSICGQAGSSKEMVEFLVSQGIDSISVNADKAFEISKFVKELEDKGLRGSERGRYELKIEEKPEIKSKQKIINKVNCSNCGKETQVPFVPDGIRPVYCKECFEKKREEKRIRRELEMEDKIEKEEQDEKEKKIGKETGKIEEEETEKQEKAEEFPNTKISIDVFSQQEKAEEGNKEDEKIIKGNKNKEEIEEVNKEEIIENKGEIKEVKEIIKDIESVQEAKKDEAGEKSLEKDKTNVFLDIF